jgi:beta-N-acetylhexosaminidase
MLIIGLEGHALSAAEHDFLQHPGVAGVILFARNFASKTQVAELCQQIRSTAAQPMLITVDQEGGRVQRFREGFAALPCLEDIGAALNQHELTNCLHLAHEHAFVMASEVMASGLDLSFAPVADLGRGNLAIGNRAFHAEPELVASFVAAYVQGMHAAGMAATLKHFPGHGSVREDTHFDQAIDARHFDALEALDLIPFKAGIAAGADAVMMAHVLYPHIAPEPAGYSRHWIQDILKNQIGFNGVVFSDDIGMAAAESAGGVGARIAQHLAAGCDAVLACPAACVADAVASLPVKDYAVSRFDGLRARQNWSWSVLAESTHYRTARSALNLGETPHAA